VVLIPPLHPKVVVVDGIASLLSGIEGLDPTLLESIDELLSESVVRFGESDL
jgi:hypothetical protein